MLSDILDARLKKLQGADALRTLKPPAGAIDFASNDYLGLARSRELAESILDAAGEGLFNGSTGSRLLTGNSALIEHVEAKLANLFQGEAALIFNSGYAANTAILSSIPQKGNTIFFDELAHASIKDGARLSLAERYSFRHNDLNDLERKLHKAKGERFVVVESIYSMDGDQAPLAALSDLANQQGFTLIVDEAHSTGIVGAGGCGLCVTSNLQQQVPVRIYTFGKAMGTHGACVVGSRLLIDCLINAARPFVYSTALPPHAIISIEQAFDFLGHHPELQQSLWSNIGIFTDSFPNPRRRSPIQPIIIPGNETVKEASQLLLESNFDVRPIISPTVRAGSERLRVVLHAFNTETEIRNLTAILCQHWT